MDDLEGFVCAFEPAKVEEWVKSGGEEGECPPCLITPLSSYYLAQLEEAGETEQAGALKEAYEKGDVLTIARTLDTVKDNVGEPLAETLKTLDCFAQSFGNDDDD